jgi:ubiquinone/menaquinone biosynthesis C-methylase UbiE
MNNTYRLLPKNLLIKTSLIDHADWNYRPFLKFIQQKRFQLVLALIGNRHYDQILEIGYGSGIFMPILKKFCTGLYGIDIHSFNAKVSQNLSKYGVTSNLFQGSVSQMPFLNESFDLIVSISTFEFIQDKDSACMEIKRVLKQNGQFILITPAESWLLDVGFRLMTHENAKHDFGSERQVVFPILKEHFYISERKIFPSVLGKIFPIYRAFVLTCKK